MARFIIADLTDPSSIPKELEAIVPGLAVPVQPLLEGSTRPYAMFKDYWKYDWVLPVHRYEGLEPLLAIARGEGHCPCGSKGESLGGAAAHDRGGADQASMSATTACEQVSRVERAPGGLPRLPRDGADQVRPCLRPAALEVQGPGLRSAVHAHHAARHARGGEAARDRALLPGPVDERGSQARRGLGAEHAALGPDHAHAHCPKPEPARGGTAVVEIDEVWHFVKKSPASSGSGRPSSVGQAG